MDIRAGHLYGATLISCYIFFLSLFLFGGGIGGGTNKDVIGRWQSKGDRRGEEGEEEGREGERRGGKGKRKETGWDRERRGGKSEERKEEGERVRREKRRGKG